MLNATNEIDFESFLFFDSICKIRQYNNILY